MVDLFKFRSAVQDPVSMPQESWSSTVVWFEFVIYRAERTTNEGSTMHWLNAAKSRSEIRRRRHECVGGGWLHGFRSRWVLLGSRDATRPSVPRAVM